MTRLEPLEAKGTFVPVILVPQMKWLGIRTCEPSRLMRARLINEELANILRLTQDDLVMTVSGPTTVVELLHNAAGLRLGFPGTAPIKWLAVASKGELLRTLLNPQAPENPGGLLVVCMRRKSQRPGIMNGLLHQLARACGVSGDYRKAQSVVVADSPTVVADFAVFINRQLRAEAEHVN